MITHSFSSIFWLWKPISWNVCGPFFGGTLPAAAAGFGLGESGRGAGAGAGGVRVSATGAGACAGAGEFDAPPEGIRDLPNAPAVTLPPTALGPAGGRMVDGCGLELPPPTGPVSSSRIGIRTRPPCSGGFDGCGRALNGVAGPSSEADCNGNEVLRGLSGPGRR